MSVPYSDEPWLSHYQNGDNQLFVTDRDSYKAARETGRWIEFKPNRQSEIRP